MSWEQEWAGAGHCPDPSPLRRNLRDERDRNEISRDCPDMVVLWDCPDMVVSRDCPVPFHALLEREVPNQTQLSLLLQSC